MEEIWKDIKDYEGLYQVSNLGRVKSLKTYKYTKKTNSCKEILRIRILRSALEKSGYKIVVLTKNKIRTTKKVHRLVAETFISNPNNYKCVNHIDGNKLNNSVNNLEWITNSNNTIHAYKNNLIDKSKKQKRVNQYDLDGNFIKQWCSMKEAGKELKIHWQNISMCCRKIRNKTKEYRWEYASN